MAWFDDWVMWLLVDVPRLSLSLPHHRPPFARHRLPHGILSSPNPCWTPPTPHSPCLQALHTSPYKT
jgi:hypothetical protein